MIRTTNVKEGRIDLSTCRYVDEPTYERWTRRAKLLDGDVILTREAPIGEVGYVQKLGPVFLGQRLMQFRPDPKKVVPRYLYYAFRSPDLQHQFGTHNGSGSVVSHIRVADCHEFKVSVPPIDHQQNVVTLLGSLDDKIELNRRMNETLEAMAQAIFRDWFVDFGPTRRKLEGATDPLTIMGGLVQDTGRAKDLAVLFPAALGDHGLPEGWTEKELGTLAVLLKRGLNPTYCDGGIPVINQKCIRNGQVNFAVARRHDSVKRPPKERALQEQDVLVNSTGVGTLGRVATVRGLKEEATADSHVTICRADADRISKLVFSLFLEGQQSLIETMGHGSTGQTELSPSSLAALRISVASSQIQNAFDAIAAPLRSKVTANAEQSLTLAATRDLLLPKLMSGELRLSEAEDFMEAAQ
ncbi:restriction endonuclease subunit S [Agrobacterium sp. DKPNP3]|uniref:restriction endonuclease subunit S n=1 Tax=Agrobacterium sp. DKPNP3 TaxID=3457323 RepID=UPI004044E1FA